MTAINFSNALGLHPEYLEFRAARAEVLAGNIANADTPGYKSRDLTFSASGRASNSFSDVFQKELTLFASRGASGPQSSSAVTHPQHFSIGDNVSALKRRGQSGEQVRQAEFREFYRTPTQQPGLDGNSVDVQRESVEFAQNALDFSVSFRLLNSKFSGLSKAIKGE